MIKIVQNKNRGEAVDTSAYSLAATEKPCRPTYALAVIAVGRRYKSHIG